MTRRSLEPRLREAVLSRDSHQCVACDATGCVFEIDHITPVHMGGDDAIENLRTLCVPCHRFRHYTLRYLIGVDESLWRPEVRRRAERLRESERGAPNYPMPMWLMPGLA